MMKKTMLIGIALAFAFGCSSNQPRECVEGNCTDGKGTIQLQSGSKYIGQFKEGFREGDGAYHWPNKETYEGAWKKNMRDGKGTYVYPSGAKYIGEYREDKRNGQGIYFWPDGDKYEGQWKDGAMHGDGTYTFKDGRVLSGKFENNVFVEAAKK